MTRHYIINFLIWAAVIYSIGVAYDSRNDNDPCLQGSTRCNVRAR